MDRLSDTECDFFTCHCSPCYELETILGESNTYLSCSEDCTVRQYDLRSSVKCFRESCSEVNLIIAYHVYNVKLNLFIEF